MLVLHGGFLGFLRRRSRAFNYRKRNPHSKRSPRSEESVFDPCVLTLCRVPHTLALAPKVRSCVWTLAVSSGWVSSLHRARFPKRAFSTRPTRPDQKTDTSSEISHTGHAPTVAATDSSAPAAAAPVHPRASSPRRHSPRARRHPAPEQSHQ